MKYIIYWYAIFDNGGRSGVFVIRNDSVMFYTMKGYYWEKIVHKAVVLEDDRLSGLLTIDGVTFYLTHQTLKYNLGYEKYKLKIRHGNTIRD